MDKKRYALAKNAGLNWQSILIADAESELKLLVRDCVLRNDSFSVVNQKVIKLTEEVVGELESEEVKRMVRRTFPMFASKLYIKWVQLFGTKAMGLVVIALCTMQGKHIPQHIEKSLRELPEDAHNRATANGTYPLEYEKEVARRIDEIAQMTAKEDASSRYSLRASVERQLRWEWHQNQMKEMLTKGERLVWIDAHANCSERCQEWQGKLYSLDGTSGKVDGIPFRPLEDATNRYETTASGKTWRNGTLTGFNCRHKMIKFVKGGQEPVPIPDSVIKKERDLETRQREIERTVRLYEDRALLYGKGSKQFEKAKQKAAEWTNRYNDFCRENDIPRIPSRLKI